MLRGLWGGRPRGRRVVGGGGSAPVQGDARGPQLRSQPALRPVAAVTALSLVLAGCQAQPGGAPTVDKATTPATATPETQPADIPARATRELAVGVDPFSGNLNPHLLGNVDLMTATVADLTLPSAFTFDGQRWVLNSTLLDAAVPNDPIAPTSITYRIRPQAQWSDGTPVTGSDFAYLRDAIAWEPVARDADVYRHISEVKVANKGLDVTVDFDEPFSGWQQLFQHLLPSHIYRAEGQDFAVMMNGQSAASAGPFSVASVDVPRGRLVLQRNDRYWGATPAKLDRLIFSHVPSVPTGAQMLRSGQIQAFVGRPTQTSDLALGLVPGVSHRIQPRGVELGVTANATSGRLMDAGLRRDVLAAIDRKAVAQVALGTMDVSVPDWPLPEVDGPRTPAGVSAANPLIVGAPTSDEVAVVAAQTVADQLTDAGIPARTVTGDLRDMLEEKIPGGQVDLFVQWEKTPVTVVDYIAALECVDAPSGQGADSPQAEPSEAAQALGASAAAESTGNGERRLVARTARDGARTMGANLSGLCDADVSRLLAEARMGKRPIEAVRAEIQSRQQRAVSWLPLAQESTLVALSRGAGTSVEQLPSRSLDPYSGVFRVAPELTRTPTAEEKQ